MIMTDSRRTPATSVVNTRIEGADNRGSGEVQLYDRLLNRWPCPRNHRLPFLLFPLSLPANLYPSMKTNLIRMHLPKSFRRKLKLTQKFRITLPSL